MVMIHVKFSIKKKGTGQSEVRWSTEQVRKVERRTNSEEKEEEEDKESLSLPVTGEPFTQMLTLQKKFLIPGSVWTPCFVKPERERERERPERKWCVKHVNLLMFPPRN